MTIWPSFMYVHVFCADPCRGQKRISDPWTWSYRLLFLPCGCWETNPGPLQATDDLNH